MHQINIASSLRGTAAAEGRDNHSNLTRQLRMDMSWQNEQRLQACIKEKIASSLRLASKTQPRQNRGSPIWPGSGSSSELGHMLPQGPNEGSVAEVVVDVAAQGPQELVELLDDKDGA